MGSRGNPVATAILAAAIAVCGLPACPVGAGGADVLSWIQKVPGGSLALPYDVAADRRGVMLVLDAGRRSIVLFTPKGEFLREISGKGSWRDPQAVAAGPDGAILLADGSAGRVLELDSSGKVRREYRAGKNARITGVGAFGGAVYCADNRNDRILVFRKGAATPESWGRRGDAPGDFHAPFRVVIDGAGRVFVTDVLNARVQWFSAFGQHLGVLKKFGAGEGRILRPTGIALESRGRIWIGDSYTGFVQLFEESGTFVRSVGPPESKLSFGDPAGLAVSPSGLWVADQKAGRIGVFRQ